jgi:AcrB/AcrD/AcrF family
VISRFFIDRPIFASVISIIITLAGGIAVFTLPVAQYPDITPPTVQVICQYPGADAQVVADTVAAPIEQQVNGVEDMLYMQSQSSNDSSYQLIVGVDPILFDGGNRFAIVWADLETVAQVVAHAARIGAPAENRGAHAEADGE